MIVNVRTYQSDNFAFCEKIFFPEFVGSFYLIEIINLIVAFGMGLDKVHPPNRWI